MKTKIQILMLAGMAALMACQGKSKKVEAFIDGTYVNHAASAYGVADDTLTFAHTDANHYLISRSTGYNAIRSGEPLARKFKHEKLEGLYDPANQVLNETTTGRLFRFDPDKGLLLVKQAVYHKIN